MDNKVLEAILHLDSQDKAALATIISTSGSTPRKAGAQILFFADGRTVGTIGGGCGEAEVRQRALRVIEQGIPAIVDVNLTNEDAEIDGMVCGGIMKVYVEPVLYNPST